MEKYETDQEHVARQEKEALSAQQKLEASRRLEAQEQGERSHRSLREQSLELHNKVAIEGDRRTKPVPAHEQDFASSDDLARLRMMQRGEKAMEYQHKGRHPSEASLLAPIDAVQHRKLEQVRANERTESFYQQDLLRKYQEFQREFNNRNIEFVEQGPAYIKTEQILAPKHTNNGWDAGQEGFWEHHKNSLESWDELAKKYQELRSQMERGKTLDEIKRNPDLARAAECWWGKDPIQIIKYKESYFLGEDGTHRIESARRNGLEEIPVVIKEARIKQRR